jgi:hypothetical protein
MDRRFKLVAHLLLLFTLYDVSVPESCLTEGLAIAASSTQVQAGHQEDNRGSSSCPFEEDCVACAHILPSTHFVFSITRVVALAESSPFPAAQGGVFTLPYHPPRA